MTMMQATLARAERGYTEATRRLTAIRSSRSATVREVRAAGEQLRQARRDLERGYKLALREVTQ